MTKLERKEMGARPGWEEREPDAEETENDLNERRLSGAQRKTATGS